MFRSILLSAGFLVAVAGASSAAVVLPGDTLGNMPSSPPARAGAGGGFASGFLPTAGGGAGSVLQFLGSDGRMFTVDLSSPNVMPPPLFATNMPAPVPLPATGLMLLGGLGGLAALRRRKRA